LQILQDVLVALLLSWLKPEIQRNPAGCFGGIAVVLVEARNSKKSLRDFWWVC
jgi:hypothetical protein